MKCWRWKTVRRITRFYPIESDAATNETVEITAEEQALVDFELTKAIHSIS
jgi:hypothetical protein